NVFAVQQWVLPFLVIISGTLCAVSKKGLVDYVSRLLLFTSAGSCLNLICMLIRGQPNWYDNACLNLFFQLGFTFNLAVNGLIINPFRWQLEQPPEARRRAALMTTGLYGGLCLVLGLLMAVLYDSNPQFVHDVGVPSFDIALHLLLLCALAELLPETQKGLLGHCSWIFLYSTRVLLRQPRPAGPELHLAELFLWAYCVKLVPMSGQECIGRFFVNYWPFVFIAAGLLLHPGVKQRVDQDPWSSAFLRSRHYLSELIACMAFLTIPAAKDVKTMVFPQSWRRHMVWLNYWSLGAFLSHKAFFYLVDGIWPWYLMVAAVYASALPCFLIFRPRESPVEANGSALRSVELVEGGSMVSTSSSTRDEST
ncbi:unnamed protein product, partial [Effrenium voratum]